MLHSVFSLGRRENKFQEATSGAYFRVCYGAPTHVFFRGIFTLGSAFPNTLVLPFTLTPIRFYHLNTLHALRHGPKSFVLLPSCRFTLLDAVALFLALQEE